MELRIKLRPSYRPPNRSSEIYIVDKDGDIFIGKYNLTRKEFGFHSEYTWNPIENVVYWSYVKRIKL